MAPVIDRSASRLLARRPGNAASSSRIARASLVVLTAAFTLTAFGASIASAASAPVIKWGARKTAVTHSGPSEIEVPWWSEQSPSYPITAYIAGLATRPSIVRVTYNGECAVVAESGSYLSIRIGLVPHSWPNTSATIKWLEPNVGSDFALCSAINNTGSVSSTYLPGRMAVTRQTMIRLPSTDRTTYSVRVYGQLISKTGQGTWRLDDSSLMIEHYLD